MPKSMLSKKNHENGSRFSWLWSTSPKRKRPPDKEVSWQDVAALCDIINGIVPGACGGYHRGGKLIHAHAQELAHKYLGITPVFSKDELQSNTVTPELKNKLIKYMKEIHFVLKTMRGDCNSINDSGDYIARGMGLIYGQQNRKSVFYIYANPNHKYLSDVQVSIKGPCSTEGSILVPAIQTEVLLYQKPTDYERAQYMSSKLNSISPTLNGSSYLRKLKLKRKNFNQKLIQDNNILIKQKLYKEHCRISFIPQNSGMHEISLVTNGHHLVGSPFCVPVEDYFSKNNTNNSPESLSDEDEEEILYRKKIISRIIDFVDEKMILDENGKWIKLPEEKTENNNEKNWDVLTKKGFSVDDPVHVTTNSIKEWPNEDFVKTLPNGYETYIAEQPQNFLDNLSDCNNEKKEDKLNISDACIPKLTLNNEDPWTVNIADIYSKDVIQTSGYLNAEKANKENQKIDENEQIEEIPKETYVLEEQQTTLNIESIDQCAKKEIIEECLKRIELPINSEVVYKKDDVNNSKNEENEDMKHKNKVTLDFDKREVFLNYRNKLNLKQMNVTYTPTKDISTQIIENTNLEKRQTNDHCEIDNMSEKISINIIKNDFIHTINDDKTDIATQSKVKRLSLVEKQKKYWENFKSTNNNKLQNSTDEIKKIDIKQFENDMQNQTQNEKTSKKPEKNIIMPKVLDIKNKVNKPNEQPKIVFLSGIVRNKKKIFENDAVNNNIEPKVIIELPKKIQCPLVIEEKVDHKVDTDQTSSTPTNQEIVSTLDSTSITPSIEDEKESILKETKKRKARYKKAKMFFKSLEESKLQTNSAPTRKLVTRSESEPCLSKAQLTLKSDDTTDGSVRNNQLLERFHIKNFFQDVIGDPNEDLLGIPNKNAVIASFASLQTSNETNSFSYCSLPHLPIRPQRKKERELQNFHPEYPHIPTTDLDEFKSRSNTEISGLIPRNILLSRSTEEFYV